jgi:hypothetical protein
VKLVYLTVRRALWAAGGEHAKPAKWFETLGFSVSPPVNPITDRSPVQIRDSSRILKRLPVG